MTGDEWTRCPECNVRIKQSNLEKHLEKVHDITKPVNSPKSKLRPLAITVVVLLILASASYILLKDDPEASNDDNGDDDEPDDTQYWLTTYEQKFNLGSGDDDWWVKYPDQHPSNGTDFTHPSWVLNNLDNKPVVVLVGAEWCPACKQQETDLAPIINDLGSDFKYIYINTSKDERTMEAISYDPTGKENSIPVTAIVTKAKNTQGDKTVVWHSALGATGEQWLRQYIKDAIYLHHEHA